MITMKARTDNRFWLIAAWMSIAWMLTVLPISPAKAQTQWCNQVNESFGPLDGLLDQQTVSGGTDWGRVPSTSPAGCFIQCNVRQVFYVMADNSRVPRNDYTQWQRTSGLNTGTINWTDTSQYWYTAWLSRPFGSKAIAYKIEVRSTAWWNNMSNFITDVAISGEFIHSYTL